MSPAADRVAVEDQPARTSLAWSRSLLGCVAVGLLVARGAAVTGAPAVLAVAALLVAGVAVLVAYARQRHLRRPPTASGRAVPGFALAVLCLVLLAAVVAVRAIPPTT